MASLLQLKASNDAAAVSAACNDLYERKELYLKYLIVSALNNQSFYVNISNSMFYSSKLYSKTKLFDFYVNNNLFDLVVLGPDSNEVLFDIIRDEIILMCRDMLSLRLIMLLKMLKCWDILRQKTLMK